MPRRVPAENRAIMLLAQTQKDVQQLQTGARRADEAQAVLDAVRERAVKGIVDAAPLLTAEQRAQLRPILAGTLDQAGADETAA